MNVLRILGFCALCIGGYRLGRVLYPENYGWSVFATFTALGVGIPWYLGRIGLTHRRSRVTPEHEGGTRELPQWLARLLRILRLLFRGLVVPAGVLLFLCGVIEVVKSGYVFGELPPGHGGPWRYGVTFGFGLFLSLRPRFLARRPFFLTLVCLVVSASIFAMFEWVTDYEGWWEMWMILAPWWIGVPLVVLGMIEVEMRRISMDRQAADAQNV